ncbi:ribosomal-protein-alanine acetyltransferase [Aequitasia blattaphilus]|uniref:[Ribosomal protein bS18]-alanine N-acetyltransferase n=1 Tax=Aequitasia blattaphilus TaxID=2949332 RepID=A0ABT1EC78_9FIRM|nr:ribosomal protein S18-alanine N-acetyltransferase [Aequitasia blattaphilus]MCP1103254.1 ribosomal protein S18-alanine N-acetyltransferase [Aequitasia blattaphilus]MCR8615894.1 ribosomal protein S18-alanine N-acetyltransferase [Aequitasia blattaphilus]
MWEIREPGEKELVSICDMEKVSFSDAWSLKGIEDTSKRKEALILAAYDEEKIIGYVIAYFGGDEGEIMRLCVKDEYRRKKVASQLLLSLESKAEDREIRKIFLEVRESNEEGISFYTDYGFLKDGLRLNFYDNPKEAAILMSRELGK